MARFYRHRSGLRVKVRQGRERPEKDLRLLRVSGSACCLQKNSIPFAFTYSSFEPPRIRQGCYDAVAPLYYGSITIKLQNRQKRSPPAGSALAGGTPPRLRWSGAAVQRCKPRARRGVPRTGGIAPPCGPRSGRREPTL